MSPLIILLVFVAVFNGLLGADLFLFSFKGEVNGGEFHYYKILQSGDLLLALESLEGDADIYVSDKTPAPNYHPESYDLHSATCGSDTIFIPSGMNRPVAVGIFGHSSSDLTKFRLDVYQTSGSEHVDINNDLFMPQAEVHEENKPVKTARKKSRSKDFPNAMWRLLEVFEMFFL